jgi:uncharacterized protein
MLFLGLRNAVFILFIPVSVFADLGPAPNPSTWQDQWVAEADADPDSSILTIKNSDKAGFQFTLLATSGANVGELEGKATWTSPFEGAKALVDGCELVFSLFKSQLEIRSENCSAPAGVYYDGTFRRDSIPPTFPTSFSCSGGLNPVEREICSVRWLAAADVELAATFHSILGSNPFAPAELALKKEQKVWLRDRNRKCDKATGQALCIGRFYADRILQLQAARSGKKVVGKKSDLTTTFEKYVKLPPEESAVALRNDALVALLIRLTLPEDIAEFFFSHSIYPSDLDKKGKIPRTEIASFSQIRGVAGRAGLVLTRSGGLWVLVSTVENGKYRPWVYGPGNSEKRPSSVGSWLKDQTGKEWLPAKYEKVF